MIIRHNIPEPSMESPFGHCKLGREKYAKVLTQIAGKYSEGFVLALNNEWGTGKTTFVRMWEQYLQKENFKTIYFNAWENDFDSNPLIPLISELKSLSNNSKKDVAFKSVMNKGAIIAKNVLPALAKGIAKRYIDAEMLVDAIENTAKAATDIFEDEIKDFLDKKKNIQEFRIELEKFIKIATPSKPLVFIIDELDRCRPNYAVEVLEQVKHFFSVKGIVFVLSVDKKQLANSVKGFYGSNEIDTDGYLKRFFDLEFRLPQPDNSQWVNYLYNYYGFDTFFSLPERDHSEIKYDGSNLIEFASLLVSKHQLALRDIERMFSHCRVCLTQFESNQYTFTPALFFLIFMKTYYPVIYYSMISRIPTPEELIAQIEEGPMKPLLQNTEMRVSHIEALILQLYWNYYSEVNSRYSLLKDNADESFGGFSKKFSIFQNEFAEKLQNFRYKNLDTVPIMYLVKKIELMDDIIQD